jgi:hypothetical protein
MIIRTIIKYLLLFILAITYFILLNLFFMYIDTPKFEDSIIDNLIRINKNDVMFSKYDKKEIKINSKTIPIEEVSKKPSKNVKYFSELDENKEYFIVSYKEEEIINSKKYTNYATYIRDSENRYYAVDGRIFCLGIPCIDN